MYLATGGPRGPCILPKGKINAPPLPEPQAKFPKREWPDILPSNGDSDVRHERKQGQT
jgi:hypothetical protein